jgi:uncharacterized protein YfaS (alpha-2-macroglobulin family)
MPAQARAEEGEFKGRNDAGGIVMEPHTGNIEKGETFTITFPVAMVKEGAINVEGQSLPFTSTPKLPGKFLWKSQTEGEFVVGDKLIPGAHYRLALDPALKDADGNPVHEKEWGVEFTTLEFRISLDEDSSAIEHLGSRAQVFLKSSYPVNYSDAAEHIYFQDRDSHERIAAQVVLEERATAESGMEFRVEPRTALPVDRTYDLVAEGVRDVNGQQALPYLQAFALGPTSAMKVNWLGAQNFPSDPPQIVVNLSDRIDSDTVTPETVRIDPPVANLKLHAWDNEVTAQGDFDTHARYTVTISPALKGERGYGLAAVSKWGATFRPKKPTILFPGAQVFERSGRGLRFAFFQVNAPKLTWKLAAIPPEKLAAVSARVREFEHDALDPYTGQPVIDPNTDVAKPQKTELLVDSFALQPAGTGDFDASDGDKQVLREINFQPSEGKQLNGAYLLEVSGTDKDGKVVGNRSVVCFSDLILTQKHTDSAVAVRVAKMSDGMPVPGVTVHLVTEKNVELDSAVTDRNGLVSFLHKLFSVKQKAPAYAFIADTPDRPTLQTVSASSYTSGTPVEWASNKNRPPKSAEMRSIIITDRNLYRPGQIVEMKGLLRLDSRGALTIPAGKPVHWCITKSVRDELLAEGNVSLSPDGGWIAQWEIPEKITLGAYAIHCEVAGGQAPSTAEFNIQEYRVPLFSVEVAAQNKAGPYSEIKVSSAYFHGAANRGARVHWKATWLTLSTEGDNNFMRYDNATDRDPKAVREPEEMKQVEGDSTLDANGTAVIKCDSPFTDGVMRGRCEVTWKVDVTSIDGQTLTGGVASTPQFVPSLPGIRADEQFTPGRSVKVDVDAVDADNKPATGLQLRVELYHVTTKTAKEKIAPFVYRYRNTTTYTRVDTQSATAPGSLTFPVKETGKYVAAATATNQEYTPVVSAETYVSGGEPAEFPVQNETAFQITHEDKKFEPGEKAVLHLQAPFGGVAWVSVESNEILGTLMVPVEGNSGRIELPIKKEYGPNAFVSVYLVKPGGGGELAQERFAFTSIDVRVPERELALSTKLEKETVRPGDSVRGTVAVTSEGKPVAGADVLVLAVDDAVLKLGDWTPPDVGAAFYLRRNFGVITFSALENFIAGIKRDSLTQKGFVVGGGGEEGFEHVTPMRKEFRTLAFWDGKMKTDGDGKLQFDFKAPDNLTAYRIVAVGESQKNQFGADASTLVKISKPLIAEPALPRFLREGDVVELRVVVRENFVDSDEISVRCVPDAHLHLTGAAEATQNATKDVPAVFRFKAKVMDADFSPVAVRFDAVSKSNAEASDSVQNTLPVNPPVIARKESVAGTFNGPEFDPARKFADNWKKGQGSYDLTLSTSPWLPKITGLPLILDYPYGCFDQISSRMLSYGLLGDLLAWLPNSQTQDALYRSSIEHGLKLFNQSLQPDGTLPYWDGQTTGNPFCTIEGSWALDEISKAGFQIPEELPDKLSKAVRKIALGDEKTCSFDQCFALMVLSRRGKDASLSGVAQDLYLKRKGYDDETRAMLALALHQLGIMPKETEQLMREIDDGEIKVKAFDPVTFSSTDRAEAIRALAFCKIAPANWTEEKKEPMRKRLLEIMDSSAALSTQENLWLLIAFKAFQESENLPKLQVNKTQGMTLSRNGASAGWLALPLPQKGDETQKGLNTGVPLSYLMSAQYRTDEIETGREDRGFRIERVVKNLTDPKRTGTTDAPFKLGDDVFIVYRVFTRKLQNYVALEDLLPAGLETVNPDLPMIGKFYPYPMEATNEQVLELSHSELRDQATQLYFYEIDPGASVYAVLARATVAGTFRWPSTQIAPMYDSRFTGISPSSTCVVTGD